MKRLQIRTVNGKKTLKTTYISFPFIRLFAQTNVKYISQYMIHSFIFCEANKAHGNKDKHIKIL